MHKFLLIVLHSLTFLGSWVALVLMAISLPHFSPGQKPHSYDEYTRLM